MNVFDNEIVIRAHEYAKQAHHGQLDDGGLPFIRHPERVAQILSCVTNDPVVIAAAYLHDTIEDTETTYESLEKLFGKQIADLVNEVTHEGSKTKGYYFPRLQSQWAIVIKFADRLHNVSRMEAWANERRNHYLRKSRFWRSKPRIDNNGII